MLRSRAGFCAGVGGRLTTYMSACEVGIGGSEQQMTSFTSPAAPSG